MDTRSKVKSRLENILEDVVATVEDVDLRDYLDSIRLVTLIVDLEEAFGIVISDEDFDIDKFMSVDSITEMIEKYI